MSETVQQAIETSQPPAGRDSEISSEAQLTALHHAEVERFLAASRAATYTRSDGAPRKVKTPFAKTSLIDMARKAAEKKATDEKEGEKNASEMSVADETDPAATSEVNTDGVTAGDATLDMASAEKPVASEAAEVSGETDDLDDAVQAFESHAAPDAEAPADDSASTASEESAAEQDAAEDVSADKESTTEEAGEPQAAPADQAEARGMVSSADMDAKYEEGIAEGRRLAEEELRSLMDEMTRMVGQLRTIDASDSAQLSEDIRLAVLALAEQRAGRAIDELPEAFMGRIHDMVGMVDHATKNCTVNVNPDDFAAIQALVDQYPEFAQIQLRADPSLMRGDLMVKAGAVELRDLLSERGAIADSDRFAEIGSVVRTLIASHENGDGDLSIENSDVNRATENAPDDASDNSLESAPASESENVPENAPESNTDPGPQEDGLDTHEAAITDPKEDGQGDQE